MIGLSESYGGDPFLMDFRLKYPMMNFGHIFAHFPIIAHVSEVEVSSHTEITDMAR